MITITDIARLAGVSHSTVSRALAGSSLVNAKTRAHIERLAQNSGYEVNQVARNLKVQSTCTIGLIVPEVSNPYYPKVVQLVADSAREAGFNLQLHLSGADQSAEAVCLASLRSHRADGILLVTAERGLVAREQVKALARGGTPIVLMGWVDDAEELDIVSGDDAAGGAELARHLIEFGHRRIALLGKRPHRGAFDRISGFRGALEESGFPLPDDLEIEAQSESEVQAAVKLLLARKERPTAIFAYQDSLAALVYKYLRFAGVSIPEEMSVVGFDDLDLATYLHPSLTTVGEHIEVLSRELLRVLIGRIRKTALSESPEHVIVSPRVIARGSSARPLS